MSFSAIGLICMIWPMSAQDNADNRNPQVSITPETQAVVPASDTTPARGFLYRTVIHQETEYAYCVFVPPTYADDRAWPVILALHGSGEVGDDGFFQTEVGIGTALRKNWRQVPAIVVMPQCRRGRWWEGEMLEMALKCVEHVSRDFHCDPDRVYLTGLSMGGAGAWQLAARLPDAFAAVVPICGFWKHPQAPADMEELQAAAQNLSRLPIWSFHGDADRNVPIERSREIIKAIEAVGGAVKVTEIPGGQHNVWDRAYANPELWKWLLEQRRKTGVK